MLRRLFCRLGFHDYRDIPTDGRTYRPYARCVHCRSYVLLEPELY